MTAISIEITRFIDEHQPGFVECTLVDARGQSHTFVEKVPVITEKHLWSDSTYPCAGAIACEVEAEFTDSTGRKLVQINTERPYSVESSTKETKFVVLASQVVR